MICRGCCCCCEDAIQLEDGRPQFNDSVDCKRGRAWCDSHGSIEQVAQVQGKTVSTTAAVDATMEHLQNARSVLICGFEFLPVETQQALIHLGSKLPNGSFMDWANSKSLESWWAVQNLGQVGCTFGEIKNRADLIINWNVDLENKVPRFRERFFRTTNQIDLRFQDRDQQLNRLTQLRMEDDSLGQEIDKSNYVVVLIDSSDRECDRIVIRQLTRWVMGLNSNSQVRLVDVAHLENASGALDALTWLTGYPTGVSLGAEGSPRFDSQLYSTNRLLESGAVDLVWAVGHLDQRGLNELARVQLGNTKLIEWGMCSHDSALVQIECPVIGGTVIRGDGVAMKSGASLQSELIGLLARVSQRIPGESQA